MTIRIHGLRDLCFGKLNQNDAGVTFGILDDEGIFDLKVSEDEWDHKVCGVQEKALITSWYIVSLSRGDWSVPLLLGINQATGESWCTSAVRTVSPDGSAVLTHSGSLYRLRNRGQGEPGLSLVLHLVWVLRVWGAGIIVKDWPETF